MFCASMREVVLFAAAAVCHEIGHLAALRAFEVRPEQFAVGAAGAKICIAAPYLSYRKEILLYLAGPAANLAAACGAYLTFRFFLPSEEVLYFLFCNGLLAGLNLLPIWGLDGEKALYSLLCLFSSPAVAKRVCNAASFICLSLLTGAGFLILTRHAFIAPLLFCLILWAGQIRAAAKKKNRFT